MLGMAFLMGIIYAASTDALYPLLMIANIVSLTAFFSTLIVPTMPFFQEAIETGKLPRIFLAWLFGGVIAFFVTSFLSNFYVDLYMVALLTLLLQLIFGVFSYYVIGRLKAFAQRDMFSLCITLFLFALLLVFQGIIFVIGSQIPKLFNAHFFLLEEKDVVLFIIAIILSFPWLIWVLCRLKEPVVYHFLVQNKLFTFIRENLSGVLLSALFFGLYFLIGSVLNSRYFDVDDIFFDSDGFIWRYRLTTDQWQDFYWRSVHPLALLILRPSVNLLSMFLHGDLHFAAITLTAIAGALCVFLVWKFMKEALQNTVSALIMAFLFGISTSHLIFGSLIETYVFLTAATLLFFVLMQKGNYSLPLLVSVGIITMGITLTNFAQTVIALFGTKPNLKFIFKYVFIVVALVVSLTLVSSLFYPNASPYFFVPSSFLAERQNVRVVSLNRAQALVRAFMFNNIVAPSPLLSHKDIPFVQFRFYRAEDYKISEYSTPLQATTGWIWLSLLVIAAIFFVKDFKSHNMRLTFSLLGCVVFNLLLHLRYGKELFLYSPNWTYAVVLLIGISWKNLLPLRGFQIFLISFLLLLMLNNAALIYQIMETSAPYIK